MHSRRAEALIRRACIWGRKSRGPRSPATAFIPSNIACPYWSALAAGSSGSGP